MKAARLHSYEEDHLHVDEMSEPDLQDSREVIVRIGGAGLCRTDLHIIEGIWRDILDPELPYTLGHENAGWVEEVGNGVKTVAPGDPVIVHPVMTCGVCLGCRRGEDAVIDFVGEHGTTEQGPEMLAQGGRYYVVGYGGRVDIPAIEVIFSEIEVIGNLVGNYVELLELMELAAQGKVELRAKTYGLDHINDAIDDFMGGRIHGRGVIVPDGRPA